MTKSELSQFIDAVIQASAFSPHAASSFVGEWRQTIKDNGGEEELDQAIEQFKQRAVMELA